MFFAARDGLRYLSDYRAQYATPAPATPKPLSSLLAATGTPAPIVQGNVSVISPWRDAKVPFPFTVSGSASVFENTVNIVLKDAEGSELYHGYTDARSPDVGQFGPFTKTVTFLQKKPSSQSVTLEVFWASPKDGSPLDVVSIPLTLDVSGARTLKVFFANTRMDTSGNCSAVFPVERLVAQTPAVANAALEQALKGPTETELAGGYSTQIPYGVQTPHIVVAQGTATVDFKKDIEEGSGGACHAQALRAQIERTLYQFPSISGVVLSVEGQTEGIFQP